MEDGQKEITLLIWNWERSISPLYSGWYSTYIQLDNYKTALSFITLKTPQITIRTAAEVNLPQRKVIIMTLPVVWSDCLGDNDSTLYFFDDF